MRNLLPGRASWSQSGRKANTSIALLYGFSTGFTFRNAIQTLAYGPLNNFA